MAEECRTARLLPAVVMLALMSFHDQNVHSNRETVHSGDRWEPCCSVGLRL